MEYVCRNIREIIIAIEFQTESNLTEHYRSNDMISGKTSSMSMRDDLQNSSANIWVKQIKLTFFLALRILILYLYALYSNLTFRLVHC